MVAFGTLIHNPDLRCKMEFPDLRCKKEFMVWLGADLDEVLAQNFLLGVAWF